MLKMITNSQKQILLALLKYCMTYFHFTVEEKDATSIVIEYNQIYPFFRVLILVVLP